MTLDYASLGPESGFPVMTDPLVERVFDTARKYQKELDYTPSPSEKYLEDIVQELDEMWPYSGSIIGVSGIVKSGIIYQVEEEKPWGSDILEYDDRSVVRVAAIVDDEGTPETKCYFVNEQAFQSCGFAVENEPWPELVGRSEIGTRAVIKLMLRRVVMFNLDNGDQEECNLYTTALMNEVSLDLPHVSDEMAEMWSRDSFPDSMEAIDEQLAGKETPAQKLLALRKIKIPCAEYTTLQDKNTLEQYLQNIVDIDRETMLYVVKLRRGATLFETEDQQHEVFDFFDEEVTHLIAIQGVRIYNACKVKIKKNNLMARLDAHNFELRAKIKVIGITTDHDTKDLEVRLADIKYLQNIRTLMRGA